MATRSVTARSDRPMRRWISWVRPDCLPLAASRPDALGRRPRQQRVLGGDPALAAAAHPRRHAVFDRRRAQHLGLAHRHQHRPVGELGEVADERHRPQLVDVAPVGARAGIGARSASQRVPAAHGGLRPPAHRRPRWPRPATSASVTVGHRWVTTSRRAPAARALAPACRAAHVAARSLRARTV